MRKLYLDCDGVILDTIDYGYNILRSMGIEPGNRAFAEEIDSYFRNLDWEEFIIKSGEIDNAISKIKVLEKYYDISILTHVSTEGEALAKKKYFQKMLPFIDVIAVPKKYKKSDYVNPKDAILVDDYIGNLTDWKNKGGIAIKFSSSGKKNEFISITNLEELASIDIDNSKVKVLE